MAHYRCHFSRNGVRFDDAHGFDADGHKEAVEIAVAICTILLDRDPSAAEALIELVTHEGAIVLKSTLGALLRKLQ